ncbi:MAG: type II toxin-antitoxin system RelE/ParE family toxin [Sphingobacteriales bacterium]|nr:MAG: type II toxin-antitoxin system RelE/ParE family toxin [Sphingobacteriales bacterium]
MVVLNWTPQSILDLTNISEFIAKDSPKYAIITIGKIKKLAKQLKLHPLSGRKLPEINQINIRELIFGNYRIIYKIISDERLDIVTVHHSAKRFNNLV